MISGVKRLKLFWPEYEKNLKEIYLNTKKKINDAVTHAVRLRQERCWYDATTYVDVLVKKFLE